MTISVDLTIDSSSTAPVVEESNEGELAVVIIAADCELRLVGTPADLTTLANNLWARIMDTRAANLQPAAK